MAQNIPTGDFVTTTLSGALATAGTTATIGTGLNIPATNGVLHVDYDSSTAVGLDNGPETIYYAAYTTGTGGLTGITRGKNGTTDVAHADGANVAAGVGVVFHSEVRDSSALVINGADKDTVATSETETNTSYDDMTTPGPAKAITIGASGKCLVIVAADISNSNANTASFMGFALSGAHTLAANDARALRIAHATATAVTRASYVHFLGVLTAGSVTFTAKYRVAGGTGTFANREIAVIPL